MSSSACPQVPGSQHCTALQRLPGYAGKEALLQAANAPGVIKLAIHRTSISTCVLRHDVIPIPMYQCTIKAPLCLSQSPTVPASQAANEGEVDPFVELALYDPATNNTDVLWSSQMVNEPNPKWGEKFDFTMISATSRLNITVWDKLNFFEGRFSLKGLTGALTPTWVNWQNPVWS